MEQPSVLDYSFGRPNLAALPSTVVGVCRYLTGSGKALSASEASAIHASGRFIVLNYEAGAGDALGGQAAGEAAGHAAGNAARALGAPASCVIHPSVDFDATQQQMGTVLAYLAGFKSTSGYGMGVYGSADVLDAAQGLLTTGYGWQTYAWSGGRLSAHAGLYQYLNGQSMAGSAVDFNRLINVNGLGVWGSPLDPSGGGTPIPIPAPTPEEDLTPAESQMLADLHGLIWPLEQGVANVNPPNLVSNLFKSSVALTTSARDYAQQGRDATNIVSTQVLAVAAKVDALNTGNVDEPTLAADLAAQLTASLPPAVIAALKEAL